MEDATRARKKKKQLIALPDNVPVIGCRLLSSGGFRGGRGGSAPPPWATD